MADDTSQNKTEQPTPRKLEKSREKGQIAYSADLTAGVSLLIVSLAFALFGDSFLRAVCDVLVDLLNGFGVAGADGDSWQTLLIQSTWEMTLLCIPVVLVTFFSTLLLGSLLTGLRLSPKAFRLDPEKLNPVKGFAKIVSLRAWVRGLMSIFKLTVISAIVCVVLWQPFGTAGLMQAASLDQSIEETIDLVVLLMIGVSAGLVILGIADFGFQKWKHLEEMKMSRQELQDERKEDEGDPLLRARLKRLQREVSQRSLVQDVASATVVVTNPTHFAVCLKYDSTMSAPTVVAKGHDAVALRIIRIAREHEVAVVERKPLARALFASVEVGSEIPLELYQTVAEVLTFIRTIDRQAG